MKNKRTFALLLLVAASLTLGAAAHSYDGARFGPWLYYAPYYFPRSGCCKGFCFGPADFRPTYEDPLPVPQALLNPYCPPPAMGAQTPRKVVPTHSRAKR
jgi:hypothetical protein